MGADELVAAILTVSLANAVLLLWLGLTVLLNADRRTWGMWLAGAALVLGGLFFVAQGSEAGYGWVSVIFAAHFLWPAGWFIGLALPLAWYVEMLWHAGFWQDRKERHWRLHRVCFPIMVVGSIVVFWLAGWGHGSPLARYGEYIDPDPDHILPSLLHLVPNATYLYPVFIVLCIALSVHALTRPAPAQRVMGELAYRRSRPWLIATSFGLLLASLVLGGVMVWLAATGLESGETSPARVAVSGLLAVSSLILISVLLLGQAVVAYEIFTGKTLPRGGLRRQWYWIVALALGYGIVVGRSVAVGALSGLGLPLVTLLLAVLLALYNWRTYAERDRYIENLRPFVSGPRVYDALLDTTAGDVDAATPFHALCTDVLGAEVAYLSSVGPLSALAGPPLTHPGSAEAPRDISDALAQCDSPETLFFPVDAKAHSGAEWAVPLWSERGLVGLLLLGPKAGGGLYTQEEIEVARASGERLIDTVACARMAQRLVGLQRQWLDDARLSGRHARRVLHDDVLPRLHATLLQLSSSPDETTRAAVGELTEAHQELSDLLRELPTAGTSALAEEGLLKVLSRALEDEHGRDFDGITWEVAPEAEEALRGLPQGTTEVLYHAAREVVRNAAKYARGDDTGRGLHLQVTVTCEEGVEIALEDDGVGFDGSQRMAEAGHGIAIHSTMLAVIGGSWTTESQPGEGTRVVLEVPA